MNEKKTLWIVMIVVSGFVALSYAWGFYFFVNIRGEMNRFEEQNKQLSRYIRTIQNDMKEMNLSFNDIDDQVASSQRDLVILENRVNMSEAERETILSQLQNIGSDIVSLQDTYAEYVGKLDEMGEILGTDTAAAPAKQAESYAQDVDLGEIAVEQEGFLDELQPADFIERP